VRTADVRNPLVQRLSRVWVPSSLMTAGLEDRVGGRGSWHHAWSRQGVRVTAWPVLFTQPRLLDQCRLHRWGAFDQGSVQGFVDLVGA
jgi:hypothetical protein